ncbi:mpv17-like protein 2 [Contarinia nasturtii]|uniref:mpv17-like protein 2 n=1 Tax=Contarinia nasturtii TaxID=265458 RepID=UPI0012D3F4E3|nr:mpv17-like protein 2 [Contarinia nasturtii]
MVQRTFDDSKEKIITKKTVRSNGLLTKIGFISAELFESLKMQNFIRNITNSLFKKHLLLTNTVSSGVLMSIGDGLSQYVEQKITLKHNKEQWKFKLDWSRNGKMFVVGASSGPLHHYFYGWLDAKYIGFTLKVTMIKILYDQLVMAPLCIALFFYSAGWMYKQSFNDSTNELKSKFSTVYITDWIVWPFAQFVNFHYLSTDYRVIYVNFITMLYNVFLSYVKHTDSEKWKYWKF